MPVSITDVRHIAALARLSFTEAEEEALVQELNAILAYMDQLNTLDTTQVEPLSHVIELHNVFREDERKAGVTREEALKNAPARTKEFFTVPKVIG